MKNEKTYELVLTALFTAIIVIMAFTPLGYIPLVVINATVIHIPVILGALFLGPKKGAFLGFVFGLTSLINNTFKAATASAFVFSPVLAANVIGVSGVFKSLYICFVPRILVGVVPYFVYILIRGLLKSEQKVWRVLINGVISVIFFFSVRAFVDNLMPGKESGMIGAADYYRCDFICFPDGVCVEKDFHQHSACLCGGNGSFYQHIVCYERDLCIV